MKLQNVFSVHHLEFVLFSVQVIDMGIWKISYIKT
jgi:hypothetical protein